MENPDDPIRPEIQKKKKSKRKPKSKRGKNKPTGFEEFYVDTPMTPDEYEEEQTLYNMRRPITHRIEDALLPYQKVRRLECERRDVFLKYLAYGGINVAPHMFAGVDDHDLKNMDTEQIMQARSQTSIGSDTSDLTIDFNTVVRGYLTSFFPYHFLTIDDEEIAKLATVTIRNFLSYLLYHDVCPEYAENIDEARHSCDIASEELWKNRLFTSKGPGDFNAACSTLFGGYLYDEYIQNEQWCQTAIGITPRMTRDIARKVVKFALAVTGSHEQIIEFQELAKKDSLSATRVEGIHGFEVTAISPPDSTVSIFYQLHAPDLNAVGKLYGRAYRDPGKPAFDRAPDEDEASERESVQEFEFFIEESFFQYCYPGMKVIAPIWKLNCGVHYFEDVQTVYCSIYTSLPNDLLVGWQKPRKKLVKEKDIDEAFVDAKAGGEEVENA